MIDRVGQRLDNYKLLRLLGTGTFGEVYLGKHIYRKILVAVKVLPPLTNSDLPVFINEVRVFRLKHSNIVQIIDFGLYGHTPFIVMDYAPNGTLRERHPRGTRLSLAIVISYVKQIAAALQHAHNEKLVHRDIKPENLLLGPSNEILVSDFGIATIVNSSRSIDLHNIAGTVAYMAPEQIQGRPCLASDQYALGIVIYEWLSGRLPFYGSLAETVTQHIYTSPPSLCSIAPDLSARVEKVVLRALEKDPSRRFANIQEFSEALEQTEMLHVGTTLLTYHGHTDIIVSNEMRTSLAWSPDSKYITFGSSTYYDYGYSVQVWDTNTGSDVNTYCFSNITATAPILWLPHGLQIAYSEDGVDKSYNWDTSVTGDYNGRIYLCNATTGNRKSIRTPCDHIVSLMVCSPDCKYVASVSQDYWQTNPSEDTDYTTGSNVEIYDFSKDDKVLEYYNTRVREYYDQEIHVNEIEGYDEVMRVLSWSPDSQYLASLGDSEVVRIWNIVTKKEITGYKICSNTDAIAWSPDSKYIATGDRDTIYVWNILTGDCLATYKIQEKNDFIPCIVAMAWSPDGKYIASASRDCNLQDGRSSNAVQVWDRSTDQCIFTYYNHVGWLDAVAWSPDGTRIASASLDKFSSTSSRSRMATIHIWVAPHFTS